MPWAALAAAVVGGIAGGQKDSTSQVAESSNTSGIRLQDFNALSQGQSGLEASTYAGNLQSYNDLSNLVQQGPGTNDIANNQLFQTQFANQMQTFMNQAANPNAPGQQQQNFNQAKQYFAPQQTALNQQFQDQGIAQNRLSAQLGRAGNDPTMRNMLMKEQTRQQTSLNSQIGAMGMQMPEFQANQLAGIGNQLSNIRGGLATQAMQNRMNLMSMGQQLNQSERNYRIGTAQHYGSQYSTGEQFSGGGFKGAMSGAMAGAGSMMGSGGGK